MRQLRSDIVQASAQSLPEGVIDIHKESKRSGSLEKYKNGIKVNANYGDAGGTYQEFLDITRWLPFAATKYNTSPDINDYILIPVFVMPSDLPNRNGVGFPLKSLLEFNIDRKDQAYKGWKGCPAHYEHQNEDHTVTYGVVADAFLRKLKGYSNDRVWKVMALQAIDRTRNLDIVQRLVSRDLNTFSMGAYVEDYSCSYCGAMIGKCNHIKQGRLDFYEKNGKLVFKNVHGINPFELSQVNTPAYPTSISNTILHM